MVFRDYFVKYHKKLWKMENLYDNWIENRCYGMYDINLIKKNLKELIELINE